MSFRNCIDNAEKEGRISPARAAELRALYDENFRQLELTMGAAAENEAARLTFDAAVFEAAERRRRTLLQAKVGGELTVRQRDFRNFRGEEDYGEFLINLIEDVGGKLGGSSVNSRYRALRGRAHSRMAGLVEKFERDALTRTRNKALLRDVVRAAFGDKAAPPEARRLADAWLDAAEFLRKRFNAAGGHIGKLENWGMPQQHDRAAIRRAGYETWRADILPSLDRARMIDARTGKPFSDGALELALKEVFETITTGGANKIVPSGAATGRMLGNRRSEHRFLIFRDAEGWLAYQDKYGQRDAFSAMFHHLDVMARETAEMEILGPNPMATLRLLTEAGEKWAKIADAGPSEKSISRFDRFNGKATQAMNMYSLHTGSANAPVNGFVARSVRATRDFLTSAQLGSAFLSASTDIFTQAQARAFNGLPMARQLPETVRLMIEGSKDGTANPIRAGLIADGAAQIGLAQARYMGEIDATGVMARLADATLRFSLLSPWTQAGRWAFGMEFLGSLAERRGKTLAALKAGDATDQAFARTLDRYGLAGAWDEIRTTPVIHEPEKGAAFLRPEDIASRTDIAPSRADFLANRVLEMVQGETDFAVPTASLRARSAIVENIAPGGFAGELIRSAAMYKSFPATITYLSGTRTMAEAAARGGGYGAAYLATMAIGMTAFGGLALQMRELKSGRDPRDMKDPRFWQAAALQGGGLGLFGDFVFADVNRFGGGVGESLSGPVVSAANTARELTVGNINQAIKGEDLRLGRDVIRALKGNTPGGNIWYTQLLYQRLILDQLQKMADPEAEQDFRRIERYREQEFGNSYFWAPGDVAPERAPDLGAALGDN